MENHQRIKILLAEDDPEDRFILEEIFKEIHAIDLLLMVDDGVEIIEYLETIDVEEFYPELIVVDLNMPKMNGREILRRLKSDEKYKHIPVIVFSTSMNAIEQQECMDLGASDYIIKPDSFQETENIVRRFIGLSRGIN